MDEVCSFGYPLVHGSFGPDAVDHYDNLLLDAVAADGDRTQVSLLPFIRSYCRWKVDFVFRLLVRRHTVETCQAFSY